MCIYISIYIYIYIYILYILYIYIYIYIYILQASFYNSSDHKEKVSSKETQAFKKIITKASEMILFKSVFITILIKSKNNLLRLFSACVYVFCLVRNELTFGA